MEERPGGPGPPTGPSHFENADKEGVGGPRHLGPQWKQALRII